MTNEEAKITLANLKRYISGGGAVDRNTNKAIDMAIEALGKPEPHWIPVTEEEMFKAGYEGREIRFRVNGRLFAIRELAQ